MYAYRHRERKYTQPGRSVQNSGLVDQATCCSMYVILIIEKQFNQLYILSAWIGGQQPNCSGTFCHAERSTYLVARYRVEREAQSRITNGKISHSIRRECLVETNSRLDRAAEVVESALDSVRMFLAASTFRRSRNSSVIVESSEGFVLAQDQDKANRIQQHFEEQLHKPLHVETAQVMEEEETRILENPVTPDDIESAMSRMKNQKAAGPDGLHADEQWWCKISTPSWHLW